MGLRGDTGRLLGGGTCYRQELDSEGARAS